MRAMPPAATLTADEIRPRRVARPRRTAMSRRRLRARPAARSRGPGPRRRHPPRSCPSSPTSRRESGITWKRSFGDHDLSNIVEGTGSGACVFDYDGDGKLDIYFPQGRWEKTVSDNRGRDLIGTAVERALPRRRATSRSGRHGQGRRRRQGASPSAAPPPTTTTTATSTSIVLTYGADELYRNNGDGHVHRRDREGGPRRPALEPQRRLARLRPRRRPRRLRDATTSSTTRASSARSTRRRATRAR